MTDVLVVLCTFPNEGEARQIGTHLIKKQYAACVNIVPSVESIYLWEGQLRNEREVVTVIKTTRQAFPVLSRELSAMHPYDEPEIISLPVADGTAGYLNWIIGNARA